MTKSPPRTDASAGAVCVSQPESAAESTESRRNRSHLASSRTYFPPALPDAPIGCYAVFTLVTSATRNGKLHGWIGSRDRRRSGSPTAATPIRVKGVGTAESRVSLRSRDRPRSRRMVAQVQDEHGALLLIQCLEKVAPFRFSIHISTVARDATHLLQRARQVRSHEQVWHRVPTRTRFAAAAPQGAETAVGHKPLWSNDVCASMGTALPWRGSCGFSSIL
jgi:hypothetical protein